MLQAKLVILPAFNRSAFVRDAEAVTGKNHLRSTDAKNLPNETAEVLSILEDFAGYSEAGRNLLNIGFLFTGTVDNIDLVPTLVGGSFVRTLQARSPILGAAIVVAPFQAWEAALHRVERGEFDESVMVCFRGIARDLFSIERRTDLPRLT